MYLTDAAWILYCCLWHRLAAVAPVQLLDWELPYAVGAALKDHTQKKKKEEEEERFVPMTLCPYITFNFPLPWI